MFLLYVYALLCRRFLLPHLLVHGSSASGSLNGSSPCLPWFAVSLAYFSTYADVSCMQCKFPANQLLLVSSSSVLSAQLVLLQRASLLVA